MRKLLFIIITALFFPAFEKVQTFDVFAETGNEIDIIEIFSPTNSNQNDWYSNQSAIFSWKSPVEITGVSIEFNDNPSTTPDFISEGIFYSKTYEHIGSGIWYFHLRLESKSGWSNVFHFKIQIDRKTPDDFEIEINNDEDSTSPKPKLYFEAKDDLSGTSHYRIEIDKKEVSLVTPEEINPFIMPLRSFGLHKVAITAIDKAGNEKRSFIDVNIDSIAPPEILIKPGIYNAGEEVLYIGGKAIPNSIIVIYFKKEENLIKTWETISDAKGSWSLYTDELFSGGVYMIYATAEDSRGAVSRSSEEYKIEVSLNGFAVGSLLINYKSLILILTLLILIFSFVTICVYHKMKIERKNILRETREARLSLKNTFKDLRHKLEKKIEYFNSKPGLNAKEKQIRNSIFVILKNSEKIVEKEIKDIENEIN